MHALGRGNTLSFGTDGFYLIRIANNLLECTNKNVLCLPSKQRGWRHRAICAVDEAVNGSVK